MNVLVWSPTLGWFSSYFSPHYYLFKTHYKHHGQYPNEVLWFSHGDNLVLPELLKNPPDIVFFGLYPWNKKILFNLIETFNLILPKVPIFIGGVSISFYDLSEFSNYDNIVGLIQGEGEVPITLIIDQFYMNQSLDNIPGLWLKNKNSFNKPKRQSPKISFKNGLGSKADNFFEIDYSWLVEHETEIFKTIQNNYKNRPEEYKDQKMYFFWESTRGCPYECVYCDWGGGIKTKVRRKPDDLIEKELNIIFKNLQNFYFHVTDANFGIFKQDIKTAEHIRNLIIKHNQVGKVDLSFTFAKNNHDNVQQIQEILNPVKSEYPWSIDIQSTNSYVLQSVKRIQTPLKELSQKYQFGSNKSRYSTNMMLCLPGTSLKKDLKTICAILDEGSTVNGYLTTLPPQSEILSPEFVEKWKIKTFLTNHEHKTLFFMNTKSTENLEIVYMYQCKSFSIEDYINILVTYELIQLLDGCYITKFARILANKKGYDSFSFYYPIIEKILTNKINIGVSIEDIKLSVYNWIFKNQPFGIIKNELFIGWLLKSICVFYFMKDLKKDLLEIVGHMDENIAPALDVGFATIKVEIEKKSYEIISGLSYKMSPINELYNTGTTNKIIINPTTTVYSKNEFLKNFAHRLINSTFIDSIIVNYRP